MKSDLLTQRANLADLLTRVESEFKQMGISAVRNDFSGVMGQALEGDVICIRNDKRSKGHDVFMISAETLLRIAKPEAKPRMLGDVLRAMPRWGAVVRNVEMRSPNDGTEKLESPALRLQRAEPA